MLSPSRIAVSSWALHRTIGATYWDRPGTGTELKKVHALRALDLLALPAEMRNHGFSRLELCHFHLPSREAPYLQDFRTALAESGVVLQTLLLDDGDLTDEVHSGRDERWARGWLDTAGALGAESVRLIAGKSPWSTEAATLSAAHLTLLAHEAEDLNLRIRIENWFDLLATPEHVHAMLDRLGGHVGLCLDFGNWSGVDKYDRLTGIAGRAETCHAKADFLDANTLDEADYARCLDLMEAAGYLGPYVIVNGGKGEDDWEGVRLQREFIESRTHPSPTA